MFESIIERDFGAGGWAARNLFDDPIDIYTAPFLSGTAPKLPPVVGTPGATTVANLGCFENGIWFGFVPIIFV